MKLPTFLDRRTLAKLAAPDETHAVRVILLKVSNPGAYTMRCRLRKYLFERNGEVGAHMLDIPVSVWMAGTPKPGITYRPSDSIADDLKPTAELPFVIQVVPWKGATGKQGKTAVELVEAIASAFNAPPLLTKAFALAKAGDLAALEALAIAQAGPPAVVEAEAPPAEAPQPITESAAAARMRKMREAKAAKKAQLQPA